MGARTTIYDCDVCQFLAVQSQYRRQAPGGVVVEKEGAQSYLITPFLSFPLRKVSLEELLISLEPNELGMDFGRVSISSRPDP